MRERHADVMERIVLQEPWRGGYSGLVSFPRPAGGLLPDFGNGVWMCI